MSQSLWTKLNWPSALWLTFAAYERSLLSVTAIAWWVSLVGHVVLLLALR